MSLTLHLLIFSAMLGALCSLLGFIFARRTGGGRDGLVVHWTIGPQQRIPENQPKKKET